MTWLAENSRLSTMLRDSSEDDLGRMPEWLRGSSQDAARKLMGSNPIPTMRFAILLLIGVLLTLAACVIECTREHKCRGSHSFLTPVYSCCIIADGYLSGGTYSQIGHIALSSLHSRHLGGHSLLCHASSAVVTAF